MDFTEMINATVSKMKSEQMMGCGILTLGELILLLKSIPADNIVKLDFTEDNPTKMYSYRGYYEDLALGYFPEAEPLSVRALIEDCEQANGKEYYGYKGGYFYMDNRTIVWAAPYGAWTGRMIIGIDDAESSGITTIITKIKDEDE